ncbi:MAG: ABC transporter ATP-binding protein [Pseudomonadales bacterium]|nr:ABC transporter ATP-binding protein [Pseudomonadales bacterium]
MSVLDIVDLTLRQGHRDLYQGMQFSVERGEAWMILGENGSGKSTLLAAIAGWHPRPRGEVHLLGRRIQDWSPNARARHLAWLPQSDEQPFSSTVMGKVLSGRYPHLGRWSWESSQDHAIAMLQLHRLDLDSLAHRNVNALSGGERRRSSLAATLAQQADVLLLDEPLSQLDLRHQQQVLAILREERSARRSLLVIGHDPNHARAFASHVLLLFGEGHWLAGPVDQILTATNLSALYRHPVHALTIHAETWFVPAHTVPDKLLQDPGHTAESSSSTPPALTSGDMSA